MWKKVKRPIIIKRKANYEGKKSKKNVNLHTWEYFALTYGLSPDGSLWITWFASCFSAFIALLLIMLLLLFFIFSINLLLTRSVIYQPLVTFLGSLREMANGIFGKSWEGGIAMAFGESQEIRIMGSGDGMNKDVFATRFLIWNLLLWYNRVGPFACHVWHLLIINIIIVVFRCDDENEPPLFAGCTLTKLYFYIIVYIYKSIITDLCSIKFWLSITPLIYYLKVIFVPLFLAR